MPRSAPTRSQNPASGNWAKLNPSLNLPLHKHPLSTWRVAGVRRELTARPGAVELPLGDLTLGLDFLPRVRTAPAGSMGEMRMAHGCITGVGERVAERCDPHLDGPASHAPPPALTRSFAPRPGAAASPLRASVSPSAVAR